MTCGEQVNIGEEGNHIEDVEAGLVGSAEILNSYSQPSALDAAFERHVRPVLRTLKVAPPCSPGRHVLTGR